MNYDLPAYVTAYLYAMIPAVLVIIFVGLRLLKRADAEQGLLKRLHLASDIGGYGDVIDGDDVSLQRKHDRSHSLKSVAEKVLRVDFYQSRYYPLNWWLASALVLMLAAVTAVLGARLFGHRLVMFLLVAPTLFILLSRTLFGIFNEGRRNKLFRQFPDTLDAVVRSVRVGIPVDQALRHVVRDTPQPTKGEFSRLADFLAIGMPMEDAIKQIAVDNKIAEYHFFAAAISLQAKSGGSIAATLENLSNVIRRRVSIKERGYALTSEARASAMILTALPIFATGALVFISPNYIDKLFFTHEGNKFLVIAVALLLVGQSVMKWMIRSTLNSVR